MITLGSSGVAEGIIERIFTMNGKTFLAFVIGTAIGGVSGFYIVKTVLTRQHDEDLTNVREFYEKKVKTLEEQVNDISKKKEEAKKAEKKAAEQKEKDTKKAEEIVEKMDYAAISKKPKTTTKKKKTDSAISVITPKEFDAQEKGYDQITLTYLEPDGTFLDSYDERFKDGLEVVGEENLDKFNEDGVLYVRNTSTETEYEVIKDNRSFDVYMSEEYGE